MPKPDITKRCYHCGKESETEEGLQEHLTIHKKELRDWFADAGIKFKKKK